MATNVRLIDLWQPASTVPHYWSIRLPLPEDVPAPIAERRAEIAAIESSGTPDTARAAELRSTIEMMTAGVWWPELQLSDRCSFCGRRGQGRLVDDHDHVTGLERGPLCRSCNVFEGQAGPIMSPYDVGGIGLYRFLPPMLAAGARLEYLGGFGRPAAGIALGKLFRHVGPSSLQNAIADLSTVVGPAGPGL